jgi:hypothetical protein
MDTGSPNRTTAGPELADIVGEVLGDLAFLVSDDERPVPPVTAKWMACEISYSGPFGGTLRCWCTRDFAVQLAANLLGVSATDEAVANGTGDALGEFMNVVCGQFITARHGSDSVFSLSIPTAVECAQAPRLEFAGYDASCELAVSGAPFYCAYRQERG